VCEWVCVSEGDSVYICLCGTSTYICVTVCFYIVWPCVLGSYGRPTINQCKHFSLQISFSYCTYFTSDIQFLFAEFMSNNFIFTFYIAYYVMKYICIYNKKTIIISSKCIKKYSTYMYPKTKQIQIQIAGGGGVNLDYSPDYLRITGLS
jgi:hypothetical protein